MLAAIAKIKKASQDANNKTEEAKPEEKKPDETIQEETKADTVIEQIDDDDDDMFSDEPKKELTPMEKLKMKVSYIIIRSNQTEVK